jgi:hypothetical protein
MVSIQKNWKSLEIFLNSKLSTFILHLEVGIEVKGNNWFFDYINKPLFKFDNDLKSIPT